MEDNFSMDQGVWGWFQDYSNTLHLLCTLFLLLLHQLHLRSSGIRSQRLGIPVLHDKGIREKRKITHTYSLQNEEILITVIALVL